MRVEIPAYTDRWMMGDRCGEVVGEHKKLTKQLGLPVSRVKLDKSGKIINVLIDDCKII